MSSNNKIYHIVYDKDYVNDLDSYLLSKKILYKKRDHIPGIITCELDYQQKTEISNMIFIKNIHENTRVYKHSVREIYNNYNWALDRIDQRNPILDYKTSSTATGNNVNVFLLDSGILYNHEELIGRFEFDSGKIVGFDSFRGGRWDNSSDPDFCLPEKNLRVTMTPNPNSNGDSCGCPSGYFCEYSVDDHGTFIASLIAGKTIGVSTGCTLYPVRVFSNSEFTEMDNIIDAVDFIIDIHQTKARPSVVNMSLGENTKNNLWDLLIGILIQENIVVVVAAGNDNSDAFYTSPGGSGCTREIIDLPDNKKRIDLSIDYNSKPITVGATSKPVINRNIGDRLWKRNSSLGSNWGDVIDILAPGDNIIGASFTIDNCEANFSTIDYYTNKSGTSLSTPIITGIVALYLEKEPSLTHNDIREKLIERSSKGYIDQKSMIHPRSDYDYSTFGVDLNTSKTLCINNTISTPNRIGYIWWVKTTLEWKEIPEKFSMNENSIVEKKISAFSSYLNDKLPVTYNISTVREKGTNNPSNDVTCYIQNIITNTDPVMGDYEYSAIVTFNSGEILSDKEFIVDVYASDYGKSSIITTSIEFNVYNVPKSPVWISPPSGYLGTVENLSPLSPITLVSNDPDNLSIKYSIIPNKFSLPNGISLVNDVLAGTPYSLPKNKDRYEFLIRSTNSAGLFTDRYFYFDAVVPNESHYFNQSWLNSLEKVNTSQGFAHRLIFSNMGSNVSCGLEVINPDNDKLSYKIVSAGGNISTQNSLLPIGLRINDTGVISGVISQSNDPGIYFFKILVSDGNNFGNPTTENTIFCIEVVDGVSTTPQPSEIIIWDTPEGSLGSLYETYESHFYVLATNPNNQPIKYRISPSSNSLPPGLSLDEDNGYIRGKMPFVDSVDTTYQFTIRASINNNFQDRTFSITVVNILNSNRMMNVYAKFNGFTSIDIKEWSHMYNIIPPEYVFRENDSNFNRIKDLKMYVVGGLKPIDNSKMLLDKLRDYHKVFKLRLGKIETARAEDLSGNYIYDVVYFRIIDPMYESGGFDRDLNEVMVENPHGFNRNISELYIKKDDKVFFPNSISNARNDLIIDNPSKRSEWISGGTIIETASERGIGLVNEELMPLWMKTPQIAGDPSTIPGFVPSLIFIYAKPYFGQNIVDALTLYNANNFFSGKSFDVDRYYIENQEEVFTKFDLDISYNYSLYFISTSGQTEIQLDNQSISQVQRIRKNNLLLSSSEWSISGDTIIFTTPLGNNDNITIEMLTMGDEIIFDPDDPLDPSDQYTIFDQMVSTNGKYYKFPPGDNEG